MNPKSLAGLIAGALVIFALVILGTSATYVVEPGHRGVEVVLGRVSSAFKPEGFGFKPPFITTIVPQAIRQQSAGMVADCYSSDLERKITPCQLGGKPDCSNCGCIASAGLEAIGRHKVKGTIPVGKIFYASLKVGQTVERLRGATP